MHHMRLMKASASLPTVLHVEGLRSATTGGRGGGGGGRQEGRDHFTEGARRNAVGVLGMAPPGQRPSGRWQGGFSVPMTASRTVAREWGGVVV